jgi:outer membrane protein OmpA-like peptidoglycan-associated protein
LIGSGDSAFVVSWDPDTDRAGIYIVRLSEDLRPLPSCRFSSRVIDARTQQKVSNVSVSIADTSSECDTTIVSVDTADGTYLIDLPAHTRYAITTAAPSYVRHHQVIGVRTLDSTMPLRTTTRIFDTRVPLASVYFNRGEAQLTDEAIAALSDLVARYELRQIDLVVTGYTDVLGTAPMNRTLSAQRAESVAVELARMGIAADRITAVGRGIENPGTLIGLGENPQSRRVDIFAAERSGRGNVKDR